MRWLRSSLLTLIVPGTVLVWGPLAILATTHGRYGPHWARWLGVPFLILGLAGFVWCNWDFARRGKGTLAVTDAPRFLVRGGPYRYVRNPMYLSAVAILAGETLLSRAGWMVVWTGGAALYFYLLAVVYEEPHLARVFGADYDEYRLLLPRWLPRRPRH